MRKPPAVTGDTGDERRRPGETEAFNGIGSLSLLSQAQARPGAQHAPAPGF